MSVTISRITVTFTIHATEDMNNNLLALYSLIPEKALEECECIEDQLEGGYGNSISFIQYSTRHKKNINLIMKNISKKLSLEEKKNLSLDFKNRFEQGRKTFYIRFDKEKAFQNRFVITNSSNAIKVIIKLNSYSKDSDFKTFLADQNIIVY